MPTLEKMIETAKGHANVLLALQTSGQFTTEAIIEYLPQVQAALRPLATDPIREGVAK